ncbi:MAG TPA: AI-2E family transporter, partial [Roseiflexaceae bacterium]|nr:AI-2E family transporter [Roseiflexaceae bacterium]
GADTPLLQPAATALIPQPLVLMGIRWLLVILALYVVLWLFGQAGSALGPFILGLVLAYLLMPFVNRLNAYMPRWAAILTVYVVGGIVVGTSIAYIAPVLAFQTRQLFRSLPSIDELDHMVADLLVYYRSRIPEDLQQPIETAVNSAIRSLQTNLTSYAQSIGTFLVGRVVQVLNTVTYIIGLLIIPIWLFYVLNDAGAGRAAIDKMLHPRARNDFWNVWDIVNAVLSNYVRGQLILGLAVGAAVGIGLVILDLLGFDIPYALLLSIVAGITELVPIIGPVIGAIPGVLLGFTISPAAGVAALVLYIVVQQLENNFLVPRIVGESIGIHPAILTVVLIAMGQAFGLLGIILSAPVAAILRDLFVYAYHRFSAEPPAEARAAVHEHLRGKTPPPPAPAEPAA